MVRVGYELQLCVLLFLLAVSCSGLQPDISASPAVLGEGNQPLPYVGEIRWITFNYPPEGWAIAHGQAVEMNRFRSLLNIIGNEYGEYGPHETFVLPNLLDPRLNDTSSLSEDELQKLISENKDWVLLPIIALGGMLPTQPLYPVINPDHHFSMNQKLLDRIDIDAKRAPKPPRFGQADVEIESRMGIMTSETQEANRQAGLDAIGPNRPVDPKA